jgi:hypothetical protein
MDWVFILAVAGATVVGFIADAAFLLWVVADELNNTFSRRK